MTKFYHYLLQKSTQKHLAQLELTNLGGPDEVSLLHVAMYAATYIHFYYTYQRTILYDNYNTTM